MDWRACPVPRSEELVVDSRRKAGVEGDEDDEVAVPKGKIDEIPVRNTGVPPATLVGEGRPLVDE